MSIFDLLVLAQANSGAYLGCPPGASCPASTFHAISAAWATLGYWVQADIIHYLVNTDFGLWAPLLYCIAAAGGFVGVAMGMPPKTYMWFFIGPAIYSWLLGTTQSVHGVEWQVAGVPQDQREVWRQAEIGMRNSNIAKRYNEDGQFLYSINEGPAQAAEVSTLFLWVDEVTSSTVQWLIRWTGVYSQQPNRGVASADTTISDVGMPGGDLNGKRYDGGEWHLISPMKWRYLEDITGAVSTSPVLMELFDQFAHGQCGDILAKYYNIETVADATNTRSTSVPESIFLADMSSPDAKYTQIVEALSGDGAVLPFVWRAAKTQNGEVTVPASEPLRKFLTKRESVAGEIGGFRQFVPALERNFDTILAGVDPSTGITREGIPCSNALEIIVHAMRWEAGQVFYHLTSPMFSNLTRHDMVYNLFYGWNLRKPNGEAPRSIQEMEQFLQNLIFAHLIKNHIATQLKSYDYKARGEGKIISDAMINQRFITTKNKYGEVYVWAMMIPKLQALLLYVLALAYPFCCVMVIMPGWHKIMLTWISFWVWAKLWDVGFAISLVMERSLWANVGQESMFAREIRDGNGMLANAAARIFPMNDLAQMRVGCADGTATCAIPIVQDTLGGIVPVNNIIQLFDRAMAVAPRLDLDVANGYYIFFVSALYFAVPAVTGQLVLGAKAGAASLATNALGVAGEVGKAAGGVATADLQQRGLSSQATQDQALKMKQANAMGLGAKIFGAQNQAAMAGLGQQYSNAYGQQLGQVQSNLGNMRFLGGDLLKADGGFLSRSVGLMTDKNGNLTPRTAMTAAAFTLGGASVGLLNGESGNRMKGYGSFSSPELGLGKNQPLVGGIGGAGGEAPSLVAPHSGSGNNFQPGLQTGTPRTVQPSSSGFGTPMTSSASSQSPAGFPKAGNAPFKDHPGGSDSLLAKLFSSAEKGDQAGMAATIAAAGGAQALVGAFAAAMQSGTLQKMGMNRATADALNKCFEGLGTSAASILQQATGQVLDNAGYAYTAGVLNNSAAITGLQSDFNRAGFAYGTNQTGYQQSGSRWGEVASEALQASTFSDKNRFAHQMAWTSAAGVFAGTFNGAVGGKSSSMPFIAASGYGGEKAKSDWDFFNPNRSGGYMSMAGGYQSRMLTGADIGAFYKDPGLAGGMAILANGWDGRSGGAGMTAAQYTQELNGKSGSNNPFMINPLEALRPHYGDRK